MFLGMPKCSESLRTAWNAESFSWKRVIMTSSHSALKLKRWGGFFQLARRKTMEETGKRGPNLPEVSQRALLGVLPSMRKHQGATTLTGSHEWNQTIGCPCRNQTLSSTLFLQQSKPLEDNTWTVGTSLMRVNYNFYMLWNTQYTKCIGTLQGTLNKTLGRYRAPRMVFCCYSVQKAPYAGSHEMGMLPHNQWGNQRPCSRDILGLLWALCGDSTHRTWHVGYNVANTLAASIAEGEHKRQPELDSCTKCKTCQVCTHTS